MLRSTPRTSVPRSFKNASSLRLSAPCRISLSSARPVVNAVSRSRSINTIVASAKAPGTVKIIIQGRKLQVTDAIKAHVEDKISKSCAKFIQEVKEVDVTLKARGGDTGTHGKKEQTVDVTIYTIRNGVVRVEESEASLYAAIDVVCDKIERKLIRIKERAIAKGKWPGRAGPKGGEEEEFEEYLKEVKYETKVFDQEQALTKQFDVLNKVYPSAVRRTKVVHLDPITVDEAIESLEAIGHDFYVFREAESDSIQVVYRRESEGYGIIVPQKRD
eukprot:CAMPEP_0202892572 /NCGR_PEP_ID=MMETSP1392-20130828/2286_1 /ASSEMBLY_ACC=CAM_ASM_000868 /TAXON_ID=225041 /ORGANISM="Chlamydomonas chlamydogama, Strain SAG 11-48b" /LENGTH=273 /DNA_ID=CAMNT_0049576579 /DNA_START=212 /DNA_END=1033 /DNA_ORIENTATION=-